MKRKILRTFPYGRITVLSVDMDNPINVFHFAKRIRHILKRLDVLYLNNSVVNIESMDWNVMYETLRAGSIGYFFTTGKSLSLHSIHLQSSSRREVHDHPSQFGRGRQWFWHRVLSADSLPLHFSISPFLSHLTSRSKSSSCCSPTRIFQAVWCGRAHPPAVAKLSVGTIRST